MSETTKIFIMILFALAYYILSYKLIKHMCSEEESEEEMEDVTREEAIRIVEHIIEGMKTDPSFAKEVAALSIALKHLKIDANQERDLKRQRRDKE